MTLNDGVHIRGEEEAYPDTSGTVSRPDRATEALRRVLDAEGIESRPLRKPMHLQPGFAQSPSYVNGISESLFRRGLCLPAGPWVTDDDVRHITSKIAAAIG